MSVEKIPAVVVSLGAFNILVMELLKIGNLGRRLEDFCRLP